MLVLHPEANIFLAWIPDLQAFTRKNLSLGTSQLRYITLHDRIKNIIQHMGRQVSTFFTKQKKA